jgi:hypothetical protein
MQSRSLATKDDEAMTSGRGNLCEEHVARAALCKPQGARMNPQNSTCARNRAESSLGDCITPTAPLSPG